MHRYGSHISSRRHSGYRQAVSKIEVGAMELSTKPWHHAPFLQLPNPAKIANTVISGIIHQNCHRVGVFAIALATYSRTSPKRSQGAGPPQGTTYRTNGHQRNLCIDHTFMDIAGQDDLFPRLHAVNTMLCTELVMPPTIKTYMEHRAKGVCGQFSAFWITETDGKGYLTVSCC